MINCPRCGKAAVYAPQNKYRPFCSERCQQSDFYAWSEEEYKVAGPAATEDEQTETASEDNDSFNE